MKQKLLNKEYILLILVVMSGALIRFWNLSSAPPSLSHDEVAIGYNAYSILKTGKDEYGQSFPVLFRSFDDYKLPGMVYISAPSVAIFGPNELGVRFPSAFLGTLAIVLFYFVVKNITNGKTNKSLLITLFFSFSIWHINFSRQSFESNGALFFLLAGTYFLIKACKNIKYLYLAFLFCGISLYFYYSVRLVIPFLILAYILINKELILKNIKVLVAACTIGFIVILPLLPSLFSTGGVARINKVSILNDPSYVSKKNEFSEIIASNDNIITRIIYNRRLALVETILENYFKNLSIGHIFFSGTTFFGLLFPFETPFFFLGIYYLLRLRSSIKWIFVTWILSATLPGALSVDQPNALRTLLNAPMFSLLSGLGFWGVLERIKQKDIRSAFVFIFAFIFLFYLIRFVDSYFYEFPRKKSLSFGDGYKQMVRYVDKNEDKYKAVYISGYYWRPYIFTLFWKKYDPILYQKEGSIEHFGKYYFSSAEWDKEGIYFNRDDINFYQLMKTDKPQETLFILARPEFERNKDKFNKIAEIDGRHAKGVFVAGVLK